MNPDTFEKLRERLAHVDADQGWFFARVADHVASQRKALGLSQKELAELTGTTQSAIARLESGGRPPRIDTLLRLAARHLVPRNLRRAGCRRRAAIRRGPALACSGRRGQRPRQSRAEGRGVPHSARSTPGRGEAAR